MKTTNCILLVAALVGLGGITDGQNNVCPTKNCASKLDDLCLGHLLNYVDAYRSNVTAITENLKNRIENRVKMFEDIRDARIYSRQLFVIENTRWLYNRINKIITNNPQAKAAVYTCLENRQPQVTEYQFAKLNTIEKCFNNSIVDVSDKITAANNLKTSAMTAGDGVCNCVKNNYTTLTSEQREALAKCAEGAAVLLNSASIQSQANTIFNQVDARVLGIRENFDNCINNDGVVTDRDTLYASINACM